MKKLLYLFLCVALLTGLVACGAPAKNSGEAPSEDSSQTPAPEEGGEGETQTPESPTPEKPTPEEKVPLFGVWWWSDSLGDEYLDFAKEQGVTEIYYCSSKFNGATDEFIGKAETRGMKVYWLAGEYQWVEDSAPLYKQLARFEGYQAQYAHTFSGVHFDIEPHQHKEFSARREELITKFAELTHKLRESYPTLWIEYDIPFWLEDEVTVRGVKKPAFQHVMDAASRVTLMSYRDKAAKIYSVSSAEIAYATETGKPLNLGVETKSNEGDQVSFQEEGKAYMMQEIATLRTMVPETFGVVVHQIKHWYDLKD